MSIQLTKTDTQQNTTRVEEEVEIKKSMMEAFRVHSWMTGTIRRLKFGSALEIK